MKVEGEQLKCLPPSWQPCPLPPPQHRSSCVILRQAGPGRGGLAKVVSQSPARLRPACDPPATRLRHACDPAPTRGPPTSKRRLLTPSRVEAGPDCRYALSRRPHLAASREPSLLTLCNIMGVPSYYCANLSAQDRRRP